MRRHLWPVAAVLLVGLWAWTQTSDNGVLHTPDPSVSPAQTDRAPQAERASRYPDFLPPEAHAVLDDIARGGPYDHRQDGGVFQNRERLLPQQPRGYYREFTVDTPGSRDRGARRLITGGDPPVEYFYTDDHYRSFRRFDPAGVAE